MYSTIEAMDDMSLSQRIAQCEKRLQEQWHSVEPAQLEEVAVDLWCALHLRSMPPADAAAQWLSPVANGQELQFVLP